MRSTRRRLAATFALALGALLMLAPAAMAADGVGLYGRTDDKVITFFAFGVMAFFTILVIVLSLVQIRLDNRKERRKQDLERLGRP
jgi:purine-cytosine permease-like protein